MSNDYDRQTVDLMKRVLNKDSNCVDVGAHRGSILKHLLRLAPEGQHFAFEPLPELAHDLRKNYENNSNVHIFEAGLSDVRGKSDFIHVLSNPAYSGFRKRHYDRPNEILKEIMVPTLILDEVIPNEMMIRFIKIDVEGAEMEVLRGAQETIRRCQPFIVFEHGVGAADFYGTRPQDVYLHLTKTCGLSVYLLADWLAGAFMGLTMRQFVQQFTLHLNYYFVAIPDSSAVLQT